MTIYTKSGEQLLYEEESYILRGAFMKIYNELGPGHKESVYVNAFVQELKEEKIPFEKEKSIDLLRNGEKIGRFRVDVLAWNKVIIEFKAVEYMPRVYDKQVQSYLVGSEYKLAFLVNFGGNKLEIIRKLNDKAKKNPQNPPKSALSANL